MISTVDTSNLCPFIVKCVTILMSTWEHFPPNSWNAWACKDRQGTQQWQQTVEQTHDFHRSCTWLTTFCVLNHPPNNFLLQRLNTKISLLMISQNSYLKKRRKSTVLFLHQWVKSFESKVWLYPETVDLVRDRTHQLGENDDLILLVDFVDLVYSALGFA